MNETKHEIPYKIYLEESEMPKKWYNVRADMKNKPAPLLNPGTMEPMGYDDLRPVFCDELIKQEPVSYTHLDVYKRQAGQRTGETAAGRGYRSRPWRSGGW